MMEKPKVKRIRLILEIDFEEPAPGLGLSLNINSWMHAVKDVTKHYLSDSTDCERLCTINVVSSLLGPGCDSASQKAILN